MKKWLWLLFAFVSISAAAQNQTLVSASAIQDVFGNNLASGRLCFLGTDGADKPVNFQIGGGGQVIKKSLCTTVTNGAVASFNVPNPAHTAPAGIDYRITIVDASGLELLRYKNVSFTGTTFNFNNYSPSGTITNLSGVAVAGPFTVNGDLTITGSCTGCGGGGGGAGVASFKGRTGSVMPVANDYAFNQVSGVATAAQLPIDTDGTLAANSDTVIPTQKAVKTFANTKASATAATTVNGQTCTLGSTCTVADSTKVPTTTTVNAHALSGNVVVTATDVGLQPLDTDGTLAANTDAAIPSQKAVKTYVDSHGLVSSVFGRAGVVVAAANDYSFSQLAAVANNTTVHLGVKAAGGSNWCSFTINASDQISFDCPILVTSGGGLNADTLGGASLDTDATLAANSDTAISSQKAIKAYIANKFANPFAIGHTPGSSGISADASFVNLYGTVYYSYAGSGSFLGATDGFLRMLKTDNMCWLQNGGSGVACINKDTADVMHYQTGADTAHLSDATMKAASFTATGSLTSSLNEIAAPGTPAASVINIWGDSTDARFHDKNPAGTIGTTVVANDCTGTGHILKISVAGVVTCSADSSAPGDMVVTDPGAVQVIQGTTDHESLIVKQPNTTNTQDIFSVVLKAGTKALYVNAAGQIKSDVAGALVTPTVYFQNAVGTGHTNPTSSTTLATTTALGTNFLAANDIIDYTLYGNVDAGSLDAQFQFKLSLGSFAVLACTTTPLTAGQTSAPFYVQGTITIKATGATAATTWGNTCTSASGLSVTNVAAKQSNAGTIDTTASLTPTLTLNSTPAGTGTYVEVDGFTVRVTRPF